MDIPKQLQGQKFILLGKKSKKPIEKNWNSDPQKQYSYDDEKIKEHNGNLGILTGYGVEVLDADNSEFAKEILFKLPKTLTIITGNKGIHFYFKSDIGRKIIFEKDGKHLGELQSKGQCIVAPGSIHPNGNEYKILQDLPLAKIDENDIELLNSYFKFPKKNTKCNKTINCPFHDDKHASLHIYEDTHSFYCFGCGAYGNLDVLDHPIKNLSKKKTAGGTCYFLPKEKKEDIKNAYDFLTRRGQVEIFWKKYPFFYDRARIFWEWDKENYKWKISDEIDFCNYINNHLSIDTISSKDRNELVEAFKQIGRKHLPKKAPKTWVQFKDKIYDLATDKIIEATPEYFITNPLPWKIGASDKTPIIDKLFSEWVEEKNIKTLNEVSSYCITSDKFMQRIIALIGGGSNGKGTYIKFLYKFLGEDNCVSSEIKELSENRFEPAVLYRKLLCVMGEVSYSDLRNTNMLKKIAGEDKLSFQFKGKTPFTDENSATCICLTNSLPITPDKSIGFYRKWLIVDFPNQFKEIKINPVDKISDEEFENLARKCLGILKELYKNPSFTNEGDFEERAILYEEKSNPVMQFVNEKCEEIAGINIPLRDFTNICNEWLKKKNLRIMTANQISKILRGEGFIVGNRIIDGISARVILNLKISKIVKIS